MKTKDLIKLLQEADTSGEFEVLIENSDIESLDVLPAYYDGRITVIKERDKNFRPIKSEVTGSGVKLNLYRHSWTEKFLDSIIDIQQEYPVDSGVGASGEKEYNWMTAEVIAKKIKLTIVAESIDPKVKEFTNSLRTKYIKHITDNLLYYINRSGHFKTKNMSVTANKLVEKCSDVGFPLEVFRFGKNYVCNRNANWLGYEFKIDLDGNFFVKTHTNKEYLKFDIDEFDFKKVFDEYHKKMIDSY
jgi:hypothetical protein